MRRLLPALALSLAVTSLAGCGGDDQPRVTLRVFAAASLTESFTTLAEQFEKDHPGTKVELNFGPSSGLVEQIGSGAPADVFASASPSNMETLVQDGDAGDPQDFASNSMEIAVPAKNPARIEALSDLVGQGVKVALCQPQVPCGKVSTEVFERAGLKVRAVTEEVDVKSVLTKVTLGEVDAGVVYVTDVRAAGDKVRGIEIPDSQNASTTYPIATLRASEHAKQADEFVDLVLSGAGAKVLADAGFEVP